MPREARSSLERPGAGVLTLRFASAWAERERKKKRMFDEKADDELNEISEEKKFELLTIQIIDRIISELRQRFEAIQNMNGLFGFLNGARFEQMSKNELKIHANELAVTYKDDLDQSELEIEVESFKYHALDLGPNIKKATPLELLVYICQNGLHDAYPNITTALRIFLTIPVSVASNERSFSKLKIIKKLHQELDRTTTTNQLGHHINRAQNSFSTIF